MARETDKRRLEEIGSYVVAHPGVRPAEIARELDLHRSTITRSLSALEDAGLLLSEDRHGRLWPFRR
ncbi:MAG: hypothetical protein CVU38_10865 [Chloroflexi bacterium HGW-Chloroflexi-1]|nr:MAG: hypothetical protein CVU38_10865 [Chloroflexi bacterium HGW-Chloroflexi-1]